MGADLVLVLTESGTAVFGRGLAVRTGLGGEGGVVVVVVQVSITAGEEGREIGALTVGFLMRTGGSDSSLDVLQRFLGLYL